MLTIGFDEEQEKLILKACRLIGLKKTSFIRNATVEKARGILK